MKQLIIPKGWHKCVNFLPKVHLLRYWDGEAKYTFKFDDSFKIQNSEPQVINKLFGISYGLFNATKEADYIGWCYDDVSGLISLVSVSYHNGAEIKQALAIFSPEDTNIELSILVAGYPAYRQVYFYMNDTLAHTRTYYSNERPIFIVDLGPTYGEKETAPKTIKLEYK